MEGEGSASPIPNEIQVVDITVAPYDSFTHFCHCNLPIRAPTTTFFHPTLLQQPPRSAPKPIYYLLIKI